MKTLPKIPKSIPAHIRAEAKSRGLVYVGKGRLRSQGCLFPNGEVSFRYRKSDEYDLLERDTWNGTTPTADYFASPEIAAKYFTIPKKTPAYTRGAKGRFVKKVTYPDVKNVECRPLGLAHSITNCDLVLDGDRESLLCAFTWATAAPNGENFSYWQNRKYGSPALSPADLDFIRAVRDEFKARLALEEKAKAEAAAKAKREEEEKKSRRPRVGEVWQSDYGMDHLVARVSYNTALLISVCNANRKNERALELDGNNSVPNDQNLTFVAASLEEYFKAKLLKS